MRKVAWRDDPSSEQTPDPERQGWRFAWKDPPAEEAQKAAEPEVPAPEPVSVQSAVPGQIPAADTMPAQIPAADTIPAQVPAKPAVPAQAPAKTAAQEQISVPDMRHEPHERKLAWKDPPRKHKQTAPRKEAEEPRERRIAWKDPAPAQKKAGEKTAADAHDKKAGKKKNTRRQRQRLLIAGLVFGVIAAAGLGVFVKELGAYRKSAAYYERLAAYVERDLTAPAGAEAGTGGGSETAGSGTETAGSGTETANRTAGSRFGKVRGSSLDFSYLRRINPDVAGWLSMPQISFSGPVVWCGNNVTYLDKAFDWAPSRNGCLFLAADAASDFSLPYSLIYGRNMHNGTMFGKLDRYKKKAFFEKNPKFLLYTPRQDYECAVFSCYRTEDLSEVYRMDWKNAGEYSEFLERIKAASAYDTGVNVFPGDKVLTLSTCNSAYTGGKDRFVVHAVMRRIE